MSTTCIQKSPTNQQLLITSHKVFFTVHITRCLRSMSVVRLYSNYNISKRVRHKYRELANQKSEILHFLIPNCPMPVCHLNDLTTLIQ